ncbi:MAG: hypothetical protein AMXMBFR84_14700 [Candidatus Hydrogenedentota bacterium]
MQWVPRIGCISAVMAGSLLASWFAGASADELQRPDPGKRVKVFIFAGQSNMEGRADGERLSPGDRARIERAQRQVQLAYNYEPVEPLDVVAPSDRIKETYKIDRMFGPELFFGVALSEAWPEEKFLFIKRTEGGTSLHGCWNPDWDEKKAAVMGEEKEPRLYGEMASYVKDVLSGYARDEYEICAFLWVQGEADDGTEESEAAYGANLRRLVEQVRKDTGKAELPFLFFDVGKGKVEEGMKSVADTVPGVFMMPQSPDPDSPDFYTKIPNGHYDHEGLKKLGERFATLYLNTVEVRAANSGK